MSQKSGQKPELPMTPPENVWITEGGSPPTDERDSLSSHAKTSSSGRPTGRRIAFGLPRWHSAPENRAEE